MAFPKKISGGLSELQKEKRAAAGLGDRRELLVKQNEYERILCAQDIWYFARHIMTEDEELKQVRPFPTNFQYLRDVNQDIEDHQKTIFLKSRRMLLSWLVMLRLLHQAKFAGTGLPGAHDTFRGAASSTDEDHAKYLIERVTKAHYRLPPFLRDFNPLPTHNVLKLEFEKGGIIQAFPVKRFGAQGYGFSEYVFDEMALQAFARETWAGLLPTIGAQGKIIDVATPNGMDNFFHDLWTKKDVYPDIHRVKVHWTSNPDHDEEWYKKAIRAMDNNMIMQKYELSFISYAGQPVWPEFNRNLHTFESMVEPIPSRPILLGWDFGFRHPALTVWQVNTRDQFVGYFEMLGDQVDFTDFCKECRVALEQIYEREHFSEIHCVDPAGIVRYNTRGMRGAQCDVDVITEIFRRPDGRKPVVRMGAIQVGTPDNEGPRLKQVRRLWRMRKDNNPGIIVSRQMTNFIEGAMGGYVWKTSGVGGTGQSREEPDKNYFSHIQDTLQMVVTAWNAMYNPEVIAKSGRGVEKKARTRIGGRTGI